MTKCKQGDFVIFINGFQHQSFLWNVQNRIYILICHFTNNFILTKRAANLVKSSFLLQNAFISRLFAFYTCFSRIEENPRCRRNWLYSQTKLSRKCYYSLNRDVFILSPEIILNLYRNRLQEQLFIFSLYKIYFMENIL